MMLAIFPSRNLVGQLGSAKRMTHQGCLVDAQQNAQQNAQHHWVYHMTNTFFSFLRSLCHTPQMTVFSARLAVYPMKYMKSVVKTTSHGGLSISEWVLERKKNRLILAFF